jgi:hypothetical protein
MISARCVYGNNEGATLPDGAFVLTSRTRATNLSHSTIAKSGP